jgi:hypothetical protein
MRATSERTRNEIRRFVTVVLVVAAIAALHFVAPTRPGPWHGIHLIAQQLYYVPILMASAWLGAGGAVVTVGLVSVLFLAHIVFNWSGDTVAQIHQLAEITSYWIAAIVSSLLFGRVRRDVEQIREAHRETLVALVSSLDLREHQTSLHSQRVRDYALLLGERCGLADEDERARLGMGALLHDIGKIGIPDRILLKAGSLTSDEAAEIRRHPELGAALVAPVAFLHRADEVILAHHERFDGSGYPLGLAGDAIPFAARVFAVVDAFDALTTERTYHAACTFREAVDQIVTGRGSHFDPRVVDRFLRIPFEEWARVAAKYGTTLREDDRHTAGTAGIEPHGFRASHAAQALEWPRSAQTRPSHG